MKRKDTEWIKTVSLPPPGLIDNRADAAMYAILETITAAVGISMQEVKNFYMTGTFGSFIRF